jgi:RNA polymerase sigma factor (sigma-70 family)
MKPPFEEIVSEHGRTVLRVCRAVVGIIDADDAWSDTFLSALEAYPRLPANANIEAWLVTIAHHKAIDITRRAARGPVPVDALPSGTVANGQERDLDLVQSVAALPERQRCAVVYHYIAGLPYGEIAAIVGGTADAARRAAADGIAKLRQTQNDSSQGR